MSEAPDPKAPAHRGILDLSGRNALVTGGSRGVGRATALLLARAGAAVGIGYRSREEEAEETVEAIRALGRTAWSLGGDLGRPEDVRALFQRADEAFDGLDIVVVNHGVWPPDDVPLASMSREQWRRTVEVNLEGAFLALREAAQRVREGGAIVVLSSTAGQRGEAFHGDYAATKAGVVGLVKSLGVELAPRDVTVNVVAPGWVSTEMAEPAFRRKGRDALEADIPRGRVASPDDVAGPVVFLASSLARHITGEVLNVNGGAVLAG